MVKTPSPPHHKTSRKGGETPHWCRAKIGPGQYVSLYHPHGCKNTSAAENATQAMPALLVSLFVIIVFAIGLYLYAQAAECRMRRCLGVTSSCSARDD